MTETSPARNATGSFSSIEAGELLVDAALELRVERRAPPWPTASVPSAPRLRDQYQAAAAERDRADRDPDERQQPREQVEAVLLRDAAGSPRPGCSAGRRARR